MKLSDRAYDILKWLCLVCIPAFASAFIALGNIFSWEWINEVSQVANVVCTLIGALIGISTAEYRKENHL